MMIPGLLTVKPMVSSYISDRSKFGIQCHKNTYVGIENVDSALDERKAS